MDRTERTAEKPDNGLGLAVAKVITQVVFAILNREKITLKQFRERVNMAEMAYLTQMVSEGLSIQDARGLIIGHYMTGKPLLELMFSETPLPTLADLSPLPSRPNTISKQ